MSRYFDQFERIISDDFSQIVEIENRVKKDVLLVTGDLDFPDDLRQSIVGAISIYGYESSTGIETTGNKFSDASRRSRLISELHSLFHEVAERHIKTRFGSLSDNPERILRLRDEYIKNRLGD